jgi:DHA2 family multidrug resistance protein-like MFS transporter
MTERRPLATRRDWAALAVLVLPCLLVSMDGNVLNLAVPAMAADLRPSGAQLLWIVDGYVFLVAGSLLAMGALGDRIGRRRLLFVGVTLFSAASLAAAFARSAPELIGARLLMGLAGASLMPSTLALIRGMFTDRRQRTTALGVWTASFSLGGLLAPVVGGALLQHFWWGSVFLLALPVTVVLLAIGPRVLPEFRDRNAGRFDTLGAAQIFVALLAIVYGIKCAAAGGDSLTVIAAVALGVALTAAFVRRERRTTHPLLDPALFRAAGIRVALLSNSFTFFALYGTQVAIAQYLQWGVGLPALQAGLWTLPSVLVYLAATALGPAAVRRFSPLRVISAGLLVVAAGCAVFTLVGTADELTVVVAGGVIFSVGLAPVYALSTELVVSGAPPERAGTAGAVAETGAELGGAVGIALLGSLGVAVYRHLMTGVDAGASRTPGDAGATARMLPAPRGAELLQHARSAFELAFVTIAGTAALVIATIAVVAMMASRGRVGPASSGSDPALSPRSAPCPPRPAPHAARSARPGGG